MHSTGMMEVKCYRAQRNASFPPHRAPRSLLWTSACATSQGSIFLGPPAPLSPALGGKSTRASLTFSPPYSASVFSGALATSWLPDFIVSMYQCVSCQPPRTGQHISRASTESQAVLPGWDTPRRLGRWFGNRTREPRKKRKQSTPLDSSSRPGNVIPVAPAGCGLAGGAASQIGSGTESAQWGALPPAALQPGGSARHTATCGAASRGRDCSAPTVHPDLSFL